MTTTHSKMNNNTRIMFLRTANKSPIGCIAFRLSDRTSFAEYQLSTHNPLDRFRKSVSRQVALGRLCESPIHVLVPNNASAFEVTIAIMQHISKNSKAPTRSVRAARQWLKVNDVRPERTTNRDPCTAGVDGASVAV